MRDLNERIHEVDLSTHVDTLRYVKRSPMPVSAEALFAWHARPGAFERLTPPWQNVRLLKHEGIRPGDSAQIRLGVGPFGIRWNALHGGYQPGRQFQDEQVKGPFDVWRHTHRMVPDGAHRSILEDEIDFALPFHEITHRLFESTARRQFDQLFAYRHAVTHLDLTRHLTYAKRPLRVAVTGSSGLIGTALAAFLTTGAHEVVRLVRKRDALDDGDVYWNPATSKLDGARLEGLDAVVHLAGEPIFAFPLTDEKKERVYRSRAQGTRLLATTLANLDRPPSVFVSASAVGYYGHRGDEEMTEASRPGVGFLADVCRAWENATRPAEEAGIRVAHARMGIVLSPHGPPLRQMLPFFRLGLGGRLGEDPWVSWVMLEDVVGAVYHVLHDPDLSGPVNVTAPQPVRLGELAKTLGRVLKRPTWLPVPAALVRSLGGALARDVALTSTRAVPARLRGASYSFAFERLEAGLRHVLGKRLDV